MARPKIRIGDEESLQEIENQLRKTSNKDEHNRLLAVRMAHFGGNSQTEIANTLKIARSCVCNAIARWRKGGLEGLLAKKSGGACEKSTKIDAETTEEIMKGLREGRWKTAGEIQDFLKKRGGKAGTISLKYGKLLKVFIKLFFDDFLDINFLKI